MAKGTWERPGAWETSTANHTAGDNTLCNQNHNGMRKNCVHANLRRWGWLTEIIQHLSFLRVQEGNGKGELRVLFFFTLVKGKYFNF
jgi:hypothetical protein